jgi:hypothetical protein
MKQKRTNKRDITEMKPETKNRIIYTIVEAAISRIVGGTYASCYDILYDTYHQTIQETNKIIDKYEDVIQEIVDNYERILIDWTEKRLSK